MSTLWPYMISPEKDAEDACLEFAISVLQTYTASRQIDAYIDDLINALQDLPFEDVYALLGKPVFSRRFMDEFSAVVSKHLPAAQAPDIFDRFARAIQESSEPKTNGSATKKQKRTHHSIPKHRPTARFISIFLSHFINSVKLTQHQRQAFEQPAKTLFDNFVRPSFDAHCDTEARVLPALQIHSSLMNTMSDIYWAKMDTDTHEWLGTALKNLFVGYTKAESQSDRVAVVLSANALLQHAYFAYVVGSSYDQTSSPLVFMVNTVLDFVLDQSETINSGATWNGSLLAIDDSAVKIACWKLLADEWFDVISRFSDGERGRKLTSFVLLGLLEPSSSQPLEPNCLTLRSISEHLLRSANFYEAQCFKDHALSVILDSFTAFIKSNDDKNLAQCYENFRDFASGAEELARLIKSPKVSKITTETVKNAMQYLDQLLIFPMEYYTKNDRHKVIWMTFLIDTLAGIATRASNEARGKVHLLSRTLLLRLFASQNSGNVLEMNVALLSWFLSSASFYSDSVLARAVKERTKQLDGQVLRSLLSLAISKNSNAEELLNQTYKVRVNWLKTGVPNAKDWVIDMIQVINEFLHRHASKDDIGEKICPGQLITELSQIVIKTLNDAKARISAEVDKSDATILPIDSSLLTLVSLLQEYAQLRGSQGNELVDLGALSKVMVALASPCTALLQRSLRSPSSSEHNAIMKMTTAFVGSLCKVLSRYQHVYVTERVFALIWFIFSMVHTSDKHCAKSLCRTFSSWIGTLSNEQFAAVTQGFIEQSNRLVAQATDKDRKVYLSLLIEMLRGATSEQKTWLRQYVPALVTKLSAISRGTESVGFVHQALEFLATLSSDQSLRTSAYDVSLILACLVQVANPPQIEKFEHVHRETAHALFHAICDVLQNLLLYHRQQLVDIMAPFIATLQALLYCFRSPHLALVTKKRKAGSTETATPKFALISMSAPLDVTAADRVARIFDTMAKKSGGNSKRQQRYTGLQQYRIISRHAPFLLIEYFTIQSNVAMSISQPQIKSVLETGLYNMMDMTSEVDRNMVLAALDASGKLLFKNFYTSWKENHMYTGQ
ncbi:Urb2/Npa2 family-domain-containing protein [Fennellomyces sp. T-0311]|nr:Urb2/Npa2 family-domain-containing protein [Fennellomyces sp. T-0311]